MDKKNKPRSWWLPLVLFGFVLLCSTPAHAMNVTLAWDANTEPDLAGYKIYYGTISGGPYNGTQASAGSSPIVVPLNSLSNPSLPECTLNLSNGTYYFVLTAYDSGGLESGYSNQVTVSPAVTQYQLSASVTGGNGSISPTSGSYNSGTVVTLTATPNSGYRVLSWTGTDNNSSTSTTNTVTMSANKSVTVIFEAIPITQYQLIAGVTGGNGTISPTSGTYNTGTVVTLTATPNSGYRVLSWTGTNSNSSTSTTNTVTMSANKSVTVIFEAIPITQYQLTAGVTGGNGTISPTSGIYDSGTVVTLTATPAANYQVASWTGTGNNSSTSTTNTVTMSANKSVTVSFSAVPNGAPSISSFIAGGQSGASAVYTNTASRQISIRIVASDDVALSQYLILDNQSDPTGMTFFNIPGAGQKTADFTISFALNNSDGNRTLYAWVKDSQGLISAASSKTNVILDRVAPTVALSYSKSNPYKAGDVITATANFSDASPMVDGPKISIKYAGTAAAISGAAMTQVNNKQWTYTFTIPSASDGVATVSIAASDAAGNAAGTPNGNTFTVDTAAYSKVPTVVGSPSIDYTNLTVTITFSEGGMKNATLASNYTFNNGLLLAGNGTDVNGDGKTFRFSLNGSSFNKSLLYSMTMSGNISNSVGTLIPSNSRVVKVNDSDNDGMADGWEIQTFGSISANDGSKDGDHDGWSDLQEYQQGTNPNDANSSPDAGAPVVATLDGKKQVIPKESETAPNDSALAVLLTSTAGIDTTDASAVTFTVNDGQNTYQRSLLQANANGYTLVLASPTNGDGPIVNEVWVVYYRSAELSLSNTWPFDSQVTVSVVAKDVNGDTMRNAEEFTFKVEKQAQHDARMAKTPPVITSVTVSGAKEVTDSNTNATVTYSDSLPAQPYFTEPVAFSAGTAVAESAVVSVGPHMVFPNGATVFIPYANSAQASAKGVMIYGYDGEEWKPIIDSNGNDLTNGTWVVPGWNEGSSWKLVTDGVQPGIMIKVWHFSSFVGASGGSVAEAGTSGASSGGGGGCFITTIAK